MVPTTTGAQAALLIAQLLDAQAGKQREALTYYRAWRDNYGGSDKVVLDRIAFSEKHFSDYEQALNSYQEEKEVAQSQHVEGLETKGGWRGDNQSHANPVNVATQEIQQNGITNSILNIAYEDGGHDKATLRRRVTFDGRKHPVLTFQVLNSSKRDLPISIAVKSGSDYTYHESVTEVVAGKSGWQTVSFTLQSDDWKSQASNWANNTAIDNLNNIRELQILFHNRGRKGSVAIDNIPLLR